MVNDCNRQAALGSLISPDSFHFAWTGRRSRTYPIYTVFAHSQLNSWMEQGFNRVSLIGSLEQHLRDLVFLSSDFSIEFIFSQKQTVVAKKTVIIKVSYRLTFPYWF